MKNKNVSIRTPKLQKSKNRVGVLFGGQSTEHEISLRSALYVLKNLPQKYTIIPIGISTIGEFHSLTGDFSALDFNAYTIEDLKTIVAGKVPNNNQNSNNIPSMIYPVPSSAQNTQSLTHDSLRNLNAEVDCFFPVLHGTNGEDGRLQSLFELAAIPYVGCDRISSVIGMDKDIQKRLARDANIPIAKYVPVTIAEFEENPDQVCRSVESHISFPCCVKPNSLGSTIGVTKAKSSEELKAGLQEAFQFDNKALVEEWMLGTEVECGFLGNSLHPRITTPGEISTEDFYSYDEKYSSSSKASLFVPARIEPSQIPPLKSLGKKVATTLGLRGFARIDFWYLKAQNRFIFNEVNTIPGLTSISMFPKLWEYDGISAQNWLEELIENAFQYK